MVIGKNSLHMTKLGNFLMMGATLQRFVDTAGRLTDLDRERASGQYLSAINRANEARATLENSNSRLRALGDAMAAFDQDQSIQNRGRVHTLYDQISDLDRDRASPEQGAMLLRADIIARGFRLPSR